MTETLYWSAFEHYLVAVADADAESSGTADLFPADEQALYMYL